MKFYTYIYGRTLKIDFREICSAPQGISSKSKSLITQLLNTDVVSNGNINRLRYFFVREENQVIFGVGINHVKYFEKEFQTDESGHRGLRSFIGIVINLDEFNGMSSLPIDVEFFSKLYFKYIHKVWALEDRPSNRELIVSDYDEEEPQENWCTLEGNLSFNDNESKCKLFGNTEEGAVLSSLKNCNSAILIGLNNEGHVLSAARRNRVFIPNAICMESASGKELSWGVSPVQNGLRETHSSSTRNSFSRSREGRNLSQENQHDIRMNSYRGADASEDQKTTNKWPMPDQSKKAQRLKLILGSLILVILLIAIGMKGRQDPQPTSNPSVSGDTTITKTPPVAKDTITGKNS